MKTNHNLPYGVQVWRRFLPGTALVAAAIIAAMIVFATRNDTAQPIPDGPEMSTPPITSQYASPDTSTGPDISAAVKPSITNAEVTTTQSGGTLIGFAPLPELPFLKENPVDIPKLPTTRIAYSYGVASGGKPHQISVDAQKFFESKSYNAFSYDTKSTDKRLYLTFDIGYENGVTSGILDTLKEKKVPAAFFSTLHHIKTAPELIARMITEGHIIGNHSVTHPDFTKISREKMIEEIQGFDNYMRKHFGYTAPYFRFPEGAYNENALQLVQTLGFTTVFWSVSWADWDVNNQQGKQKAFDTITARLHPGAVIMLHAVSTDNAGAMADIIDFAREQGYEFWALSDYK